MDDWRRLIQHQDSKERNQFMKGTIFDLPTEETQFFFLKDEKNMSAKVYRRGAPTCITKLHTHREHKEKKTIENWSREKK